MSILYTARYFTNRLAFVHAKDLGASEVDLRNSRLITDGFRSTKERVSSDFCIFYADDVAVMVAHRHDDGRVYRYSVDSFSSACVVEARGIASSLRFIALCTKTATVAGANDILDKYVDDLSASSNTGLTFRRSINVPIVTAIVSNGMANLLSVTTLGGYPRVRMSDSLPDGVALERLLGFGEGK